MRIVVDELAQQREVNDRQQLVNQSYLNACFDLYLMRQQMRGGVNIIEDERKPVMRSVIKQHETYHTKSNKQNLIKFIAMKEAIQHYLNNKATFDLWIEEKSRLQASNDIFLPIIPLFKAEFPTVNLESCHECVIDMLVWIRSEAKKLKK